MPTISAFYILIQLGAVCWPGELDIAPDAIHDAIKASDRRECVLS
jgi:hypothetical protein